MAHFDYTNGVLILSSTGAKTGTGTRTRTMRDNRSWPRPGSGVMCKHSHSFIPLICSWSLSQSRFRPVWIGHKHQWFIWSISVNGCILFCTSRRRCHKLANVMAFSEGVQKDLAMCKMQRALQKRMQPILPLYLIHWAWMPIFGTTRLVC